MPVPEEHVRCGRADTGAACAATARARAWRTSGDIWSRGSRRWSRSRWVLPASAVLPAVRGGPSGGDGVVRGSAVAGRRWGVSLVLARAARLRVRTRLGSRLPGRRRGSVRRAAVAGSGVGGLLPAVAPLLVARDGPGDPGSCRTPAASVGPAHRVPGRSRDRRRGGIRRLGDAAVHVHRRGGSRLLAGSRHVGSVARRGAYCTTCSTSGPSCFCRRRCSGCSASPRPGSCGAGRPQRLWAAGGYVAALLVAFVALPPSGDRVNVDLAAFGLAFVPCVIIVLLSALLVPAEGPVKTPEG